MPRRTTLKLDDERERRLDRASALFDGDPPMSKVIDAALDHLIESAENIEQYRHEVEQGGTSIPPDALREYVSTSVIKFRYRSYVEITR